MIESVQDQSGDAPDLRAARRRKPAAAALPPDRLPPHSVEAEQGVLGCILLDPVECLGECIQRLGAEPRVFYDLRHQVLYEVLVRMFDAGQAIDLITLQQRLADAGQLDRVGGPAYLNQLCNATPSPANLPWYLEIVEEKFLLRRLAAACGEVLAQIAQFQGDAAAFLDEVETRILRLSESRVREGAKPLREVLPATIGLVEKYCERRGQIGGVPTGFPDLDRLTDGLHPGEMIVIAARPSMGKTALAMNIAEHAAIRAGVPTAVFSLEMTAESLVLRLLCAMAAVNLRDVRGGFLSEEAFRRMRAAMDQLAKAPLFIDDTAGLSILQLRARARRLAQIHRVGLIVVDYLQLLHSTSRRAQENRQQEIAEISGGLKALAKELSVPVLVLSQLNREVERERNRRPRLSDLRESGAIEQDADLVGLLYKPQSPDEDEPVENPEVGPIMLYIAKQRNGPTGDVPLVFRRSCTRFEPAAPISDADVPQL